MMFRLLGNADAMQLEKKTRHALGGQIALFLLLAACAAESPAARSNPTLSLVDKRSASRPIDFVRAETVGNVTTKASGVYDFEQRAGQGAISGPRALPFRFIHGVTYLKTDAAKPDRCPKNSTWVALSSRSSSSERLATASRVDPSPAGEASPLEYLVDIGARLQGDGMETIEGERYRRYIVSFDQETLRSKGAARLRHLGAEGPLTITMWIDSSDRLHRLRLSTTSSYGAHTIVLDLRYGVDPFKVVAPPSSLTCDLSS
jgi:hypothetical protein